MTLLEIQELRKSFPSPDGDRTSVLDIPTFRLAVGEQVALVGKSGEGKTTLLHIIAGILRPDFGSIRVLGHELTTLGEAARDRFRARHIGYVFQRFHLLPSYTALENVIMGQAFGGGEGPDPRALLEELDLGDRLHHKPHQMSIGQQQRVALARALAGAPELILADEPTGSLDARNSRVAMELIRDACRDHGAGLLLVTHDPEVIDGFERIEELSTLNRWQEAP